jgi:hypothetical protein
LARREREALVYLIEENRCLRRQLGGRRMRLTDGDPMARAFLEDLIHHSAVGEAADIGELFS